MRRGVNPGFLWKNVIRKEGPLFISLVEKCLDKQKGAGYPVDPLLFIALIKRESNFDAKAVSYVGAAGLTQIMPKTGKGLGMKNIYMPLYFEEAISLMARQRKLRKRAKVLLSEVTATNKTKLAKDARGLMQKSLKCGRERSKLFKRYKRDLLKKDRDDRLNPGKSIEFGYKYFSGLMKANAGPHRVKQYNGIPPYKETVSFRNMVLKYYREYLNKTE
ncbi:MAG: transglycosylase SLT domain-containing protein [Deltaproteobacteria bacterium]|nr:transglycosylase SLT domain-containing protein [Deltaproteobacteria bacterium]